MSIVNAYAALKPNTPLVPFQIKRREPGPHDVQIEILYSGICHSDLHEVNNEWFEGAFPMVPGHEIVGKVTKIGDKVSRVRVGDSVGVGCLSNSCRKCSPCEDGLEQFCENGATWTYDSFEQDKKTPTYGGYSKQTVINEDFVLKIPNNIPLDKAAPLLCAGITTYSPLKHWKVKSGDNIAVIGLGGLGHMAVKIAVAMGANVTVISRSDKKKKDALQFGVKDYINMSEPNALEKNANKFDFILNTVSSDLDLTPYLNLLKLDSTMVQVGRPEKLTVLNMGALIMKRRRLAASLVGGLPETQEMLDFCGKHHISAEIEKISPDQINDAYKKMLAGDVRYRFVIDMQSL